MSTARQSFLSKDTAGRISVQWVQRLMLPVGLLIIGCMGVSVLTLLHQHKQQQANPHSTIHLIHSQEWISHIPPEKLRLISQALDPEAMANTIPHDSNFEPSFKNPCWFSNSTPNSDSTPQIRKLRCLPYAYVLGSFQAGEGSLFRALTEHPDVLTNDVSRWQFWAEESKSMREYIDRHSSGKTLQEVQAHPRRKVVLDGSASTFAFYWSAGLRAHRAFQSVMVLCWRECSDSSEGDPDKLRECTAATCYTKAMAADLQVAHGLNVTYDTLHVPLIMQAAYGGMHHPKLIVLLRNPVDRLHCAYWEYAHYHSKYGKSPEGFLEYVKVQVGAFKACAARFTGKPGGTSTPMSSEDAARHCALYFEALGPDEEAVYFHADQIIRGMYSIFLEVWLRHWPRSKLLVLKAEGYHHNSSATMTQVMSFLRLQTHLDEQTIQKMQAQPSLCVVDNIPPMLAEARNMLLDLYRPYNVKLAQLTRDETWLQYNADASTAIS